MTARKREVISWSSDPKEKEALRIAEEMNAEPQPVALDRRTIDRVIESRLREIDEKGYASAQKVRKALEKGGLIFWERSMKIDGQKVEVFLSSHREWAAILADSEGALAAVRQRFHKAKFWVARWRIEPKASAARGLFCSTRGDALRRVIKVRKKGKNADPNF